MAEHWRSQAECRNHDPLIWSSRDAKGSARHICLSHCPVVGQCKAWAHHTGRWWDLTIGAQWWVFQRSTYRPAVNQPDPDTKYCKRCNPFAPPVPEDPELVTCPGCERPIGLDGGGNVSWHYAGGRQVCVGAGRRP